METSDCVVAIEPGGGAAERMRFFAGAVGRDEIALAISLIGSAAGDEIRHPLRRFDASVRVGDDFEHLSQAGGCRRGLCWNLRPVSGRLTGDAGCDRSDAALRPHPPIVYYEGAAGSSGDGAESAAGTG